MKTFRYTGQSSDRHAETDYWGQCSVCKQGVIYGDRFTHPCENYHVDTSWQAKANPDNKPWMPGYRFCAMQDSGARTKGFRARGTMTPRRYKVFFNIDQDGNLKHTGGPKPTDALFDGLNTLYQRERPGSNWYPGADEDDDL